MIFQEKKLKTGYTYKVEDVFGVINIRSEEKLDGDTLDGIVLVLLRQKLSAEIVEGKVKLEKGSVEYEFRKVPIWSDDDEKEICKNTHTSTKRLGNVFIQILQFVIRILNWPRRFVEAFHEAWKKNK